MENLKSIYDQELDNVLSFSFVTSSTIETLAIESWYKSQEYRIQYPTTLSRRNEHGRILPLLYLESVEITFREPSINVILHENITYAHFLLGNSYKRF